MQGGSIDAMFFIYGIPVGAHDFHVQYYHKALNSMPRNKQEATPTTPTTPTGSHNSTLFGDDTYLMKTPKRPQRILQDYIMALMQSISESIHF
jgi:hypothetical protein